MKCRIVFALPALAFATLALVSLGATAQEEKKVEKKPAPKKSVVATDAKDAGVDFLVQGEYQGDKLAAQVFALGDGKFDVYFLAGGLPGAGWDGKGRVKAPATLDEDKAAATIKGPAHAGTIKLGSPAILTGESKEGKFTLTRVERKSPTLGAKPPEGARVLFDGANTGEWNGKVENGLLAVPASTKNPLKIAKLHIEFVTPFMPNARGQGRGNSGVYLYGKEIQVLDSFALDGKNNECGGIYSEVAPLVNMCLPPLSWQTYDVEITPATVDPKSKKASNLLTVHHNGVKIHENIPWNATGNINLQNHGNPVFFRNIWIVENK
ncbi:MAG: DUF1080 domain-containing protein [Planctomycetota bacterium]